MEDSLTLSVEDSGISGGARAIFWKEGREPTHQSTSDLLCSIVWSLLVKADDNSSENKATLIVTVVYSALIQIFHSQSARSSSLFTVSHSVLQDSWTIQTDSTMGSFNQAPSLKITAESLGNVLHESCQFGAAHRYGK